MPKTNRLKSLLNSWTNPLLKFSDKETIFYFFLMCSYTYHHGKFFGKFFFISPHTAVVSLNILFLFLYLFFKTKRFPIILVFLIYGICSETYWFPVTANHSNLFLLISIFLICHLAIRIFKSHTQTDPWKPLRWTLILTYAFAGFHKFNYDFLFHPEVSCSKWFVEKVIYPFWPPFSLENPNLIVFLSFAVLFFEIGGAFLLMFRKTRYAGLLLVLIFHAALSSGGFVDFASLAVALMIAFLPNTLFNEGKTEKLIISYGTLAIFYTLLTGLILFSGGYHSRQPVQGFLFISTVALILYILLHKTKKSDFYLPKRKESLGYLSWGTILFLFAFSSQNYLGLSTAGTFSMFSNLVTERGNKTNHILLKYNLLKIFPFQGDAVWVENVNPPFLDTFQGKGFQGYGVPLIEFKRFLYDIKADSEYRDLSIDFTYKNQHHSIDQIVSNEKWTPKKYDWKMKLFRFRRIPKEGNPAYCIW